MDAKQDILVLSRALGEGLITFDQYSQVLRELEANSVTSVESLLLSRFGLSQDQLGSLAAGTDDQRIAMTRDATGDEQDRRPSHNHDTVSLMPFELDTPDSDVSPATAPTQAPGEDESGDLPPADIELQAQSMFEVQRELARGGLGRVSIAHDLQVGRDVAIKEMLPRRVQSAERTERFLLEAQVTGQLEHPGIVPIYAIGMTPSGQPFYTMKLIAGRTLADLIHRYHLLEENDPQRTTRRHDLLRALVDVCNAIAFAHSRGVLHRDIKPSNIMVGDFGETLVVDWGLAKMFRDGNTRHRRDEAVKHLGESDVTWSAVLNKTGRPRREETVEGAVVGTVPYMSPEQARGVVESLDERADIFALGGTLYEILTDDPPYNGDRTTLLDQARIGRIVSPRKIKSNTPPALEAIFAKATAFEPDARYATARELGEDITRWLDGEPVSAYREPITDRIARWMRRHRTLCISTAAAMIVLLVAAGAWWSNDRLRVANLAGQAHELQLEGEELFHRKEYEGAINKFRQAQGKASTEPDLSEIESELVDWLTLTNRRISARDARKNAEDRYRQFVALQDDALFHGMLLSGYDRDKNLDLAENKARDALAIFAVDSMSDATPTIDDSVFSPEEVNRIRAGCLQLRMVAAAVAAQPRQTNDAQSPQQRAAAALDLLARMDDSARQLKSFHLRQAVYQLQAGNDAQFRLAMQQVDATEPASAEDWFLVGELHCRQEDYRQAIHFFTEALEREPDHFWAQYYLGVCHVRLKRWPEAIVSLTASASRRPKFNYIYLLRGFAHSEMGDLEEAEEDFGYAAEIDDQYFGLYMNRGLAFLRHGRIKDAINQFQIAVSKRPDLPVAFINLAEAHRLSNQYVKAIETLDKALQRAPGSAQAYRLRALVRLQQNSPQAAIEDLDRAIALAPNGSHLSASLHSERGRLLLRQDSPTEAIAEFDTALTERRDFHAALALKGLALVGQHGGTKSQRAERAAVAVEAFDRYLAESSILSDVYRPGRTLNTPLASSAGVSVFGRQQGVMQLDADPRRTLAVVFRERGLARLELETPGVNAALQDFARARELVPRAEMFPLQHDRLRYGAMHMRRAWALTLQSKELAQQEFSAGIKIDPNNPEPYTGRGYVYILSGDYTRGAADADTAVRLKPKNPGAYYNAAGIYAMASKLAAADTELAEHEALSKTYFDRAIKSLRRCFEMSPSKRAFYLRTAEADQSLAPIRRSPKYKAMLKEYAP